MNITSFFINSKKRMTMGEYPFTYFATLALGSGSRPREGLAKVWAKSEPGSHISCSWECKRVGGNEPPHPQMNSHFGSWTPNGLPNFQRAILGVKTHWIKMFVISLERS